LNVYFSALREIVATAAGRNELIDSVLFNSLGLFGSSENGGAAIVRTNIGAFVDSLKNFRNIEELKKTVFIINGKPVDPIDIFKSDSVYLANLKAIIIAGEVANGRN
jgi:hypothetical protein